MVNQSSDQPINKSIPNTISVNSNTRFVHLTSQNCLP